MCAPIVIARVRAKRREREDVLEHILLERVMNLEHLERIRQHAPPPHPIDKSTPLLFGEANISPGIERGPTLRIGRALSIRKQLP